MKRTMIIAAAFLFVLSAAQADTLTDIKNNVKNNYNAVVDLSCTTDVTYNDKATFTLMGEDYTSDYDDAVWKQKGAYQFRLEGTGADTSGVIANNANNTLYHDADGDDSFDYINLNGWEGEGGRNRRIYDFNALITGNTWSLAGGTYTENGVECYKITCANYDMYVDTATKTKPIKVVDKTSDQTEYAILSGWTYVESTAYVPTTINHYYGSSSSSMSMTNVSINDNLPSSTWLP